MRWCPSKMVPSGRVFNESFCPGRRECSRISVGIRSIWLSFAAVRELSGCSGFSGTDTLHPYSALRSTNFRVAVRPSKFACTRSDESGKSASSAAILISAAPPESATA